MKIALLLSGGVDSSVALAMMKKQGHEIQAYYLKIWLEDELSYLGNCPWEKDLEYARQVCHQWDVSLSIVPLQRQYHERVVQYTIAELKAGRTPSPDIFCNERIKFGAFIEYLNENHNNFDKIVTGHYASVEQKEGFYTLEQGIDPIKDQSYFLSHLDQKQLSQLYFPLGIYTKEQVREKAIQWGLANAQRPDSQGICFLGKLKYEQFIEHYLGTKVGQIIDYHSQKKLGEHQGYWFYTIGQRKGLKLGDGPWFVYSKDIDRNIIYVGHQDFQKSHQKYSFWVDNLFWNSPAKINSLLQVKLRHGPQMQTAFVILDKEYPKKALVHLEKGDLALAPGQFCVFYDQKACLGQGMIAQVL